MKRDDLLELQAIVAGACTPTPRLSDREERVRALGRFSRDVLAGREPDPADAMFVCGGIASWLDQGGHLLRDYWRVAGMQGSTATASTIWRRALREERQADATEGTIARNPSTGSEE